MKLKFETWEKKCKDWKEKHPDLPLPASLRFHYEDRYNSFVNRMDHDFNKIRNYGFANLSRLPKDKKERALDIWTDALRYLLGELKKIKENVK